MPGVLRDVHADEQLGVVADGPHGHRDQSHHGRDHRWHGDHDHRDRLPLRSDGPVRGGARGGTIEHQQRHHGFSSERDREQPDVDLCRRALGDRPGRLSRHGHDPEGNERLQRQRRLHLHARRPNRHLHRPDRRRRRRRHVRDHRGVRLPEQRDRPVRAGVQRHARRGDAQRRIRQRPQLDVDDGRVTRRHHGQHLLRQGRRDGRADEPDECHRRVHLLPARADGLGGQPKFRTQRRRDVDRDHRYGLRQRRDGQPRTTVERMRLDLRLRQQRRRGELQHHHRHDAERLQRRPVLRLRVHGREQHVELLPALHLHRLSQRTLRAARAAPSVPLGTGRAHQRESKWDGRPGTLRNTANATTTATSNHGRRSTAEGPRAQRDPESDGAYTRNA